MEKSNNERHGTDIFFFGKGLEAIWLNLLMAFTAVFTAQDLHFFKIEE